ncbi:hypothetical protein [Nonomuraea jiangxiensis]|uniref:Uncharacterized protein n=1 Tax=Nonomuraea jiangxiensis TaxID=633440 RepID=A0A1G9UPZ0_9ACTN|nr:hypothetical protein [Nonomuraea jiangxiensis]SDM61907.1 hypothetical protein SAMN05421869_14944 [Nonomuraea jiangxiensis]
MGVPREGLGTMADPAKPAAALDEVGFGGDASGGSPLRGGRSGQVAERFLLSTGQ